jgi:hypothetical protein
MHIETAQGLPIKILHSDNAKENLAAVKKAKGENWKLAFKVKLTAQKTPQQNSQAKTAFTVLAGQARSMMNAAKLPDLERFKLFPEAAITATYLNNLVPVTLNGDTNSQWEHAGYEIPSWAKILRTFGEDGTIKDGKRGKVLDRGTTAMFVGYNSNHAGNCLWLCNPERSSIGTTQDIIWLGCMFYTSKTADLMEEMIILVPMIINATIGDNEDVKNLEIVTLSMIQSNL